MTPPRWEYLLLKPVEMHLKGKGYIYQQPEMPFFDQRIDLYAYSEKKKETVAVELKLRRWREALRQALLYQLCADRVLVAMPSSAIRIVDQNLFAKHGVGLLSVCPRGCRQIVRPESSSVVRKRYRLSYIRLVKGLNR